MMGTQKPLASLSSTLLARKGTARPAMRPQGFGGFGAPQNVQDDLGWNDMGEPEQVVAATVAVMPPVLVQREALQEELAAPAPTPVIEQPVVVALPTVVETSEAVVTPAEVPPRKSVSVATATRIGRETRAKHKNIKGGGAARSAFTLRLDADRHLLLRLASALENRSAQTLVTEALDAFLTTLPDVAELASQVPNRAMK